MGTDSIPDSCELRESGSLRVPVRMHLATMFSKYKTYREQSILALKCTNPNG
ncbi:hypothetical protein SPHINGOAX6_10116 [Sphingomonas sp. AX6]|nr:hypothetical protein SPHINGOAX6_10116 [Sphingomonas sp. AX6]